MALEHFSNCATIFDTQKMRDAYELTANIFVDILTQKGVPMAVDLATVQSAMAALEAKGLRRSTNAVWRSLQGAGTPLRAQAGGPAVPRGAAPALAPTGHAHEGP